MKQLKIGVVLTPMHNFQGAVETIWSIKSLAGHNIQVYIQPQWRARVPLAAAWNAGAQQAFDDGCDYALVCNDDILLAPESLDNMIAEYVKLRDKDQVIMITPNNIKLQLPDPYLILNYQCPPDPFTYTEHPNFSCFLIAPEFFDLVGTFDENFVPAWYEDNDMHRRAQLLGYKLIATTAAPQVHFGGVSTSMMVNPDSGVSQRYYVEKWGGIPVSHPGSADIKEHYLTPYNDPKLTPKDWNMRMPI